MISIYRNERKCTMHLNGQFIASLPMLLVPRYMFYYYPVYQILCGSFREKYSVEESNYTYMICAILDLMSFILTTSNRIRSITLHSKPTK